MLHRPAGADAAAAIDEQLPQRRRRLGSSLLALGTLLLALQSLVEWWLPYDPTALEALRRAAALPALSAAQLVWAWALLCALALLALGFARSARAALPLGALAGALLGSAHGAAGGAAASLAMLLLAGVASLGWQGAREGGLALLLATALAVAGWDVALSAFPSLWTAAAVLVAMFVWIDRQHLRAGDRRLFAALAERDALITRLDQRGEELTALQKARTRLLASISHDLRQPLQAVRLFAEALQRRPDGADAAAEEARRQDLLRQQMRAADDAVAMLDQFSEFSAIEQGALQSHPTLLDLREVLDGVAATLQATHPGSALLLRVHGRRQWVRSDRTQLARLVQNLAGNAVRYSLGAKPGRPARVVLAVRPHRMAGGEGLAIDVVDNGRGIPADQLDAIFEPYVQLADAGSGASRGGRGLGLAIVRGLVAQLGLALAPVRSAPGRGTRFRVLMPPGLRQHGPAPTAVPPPAAAERLDGWLLALLDDEAAPRAALRAALEGAGATVVDAGTLEQLVERLDDEPRFPDALVFDLDLGAGRPDGLAALDTLRGQWELPALPAVIVTGRIAALGTLPMPRRCTLLAKPVPLALLVATLHHLARRAPPPAPTTPGAG
ncbi:MAG: HAMP domain-containing histidine kinase [Rubrivivax sp.]|nr:HAMP domain-containing histidine kinase [Rubrivivax sp.]